MNDITKSAIKRLLKRFGIRVSGESCCKFGYNQENYSDLTNFPTPIIFDVGANIGQSAIWFSKSFPKAQIYAFEPVPSVFKRLQKEVSSKPKIEAYNIACGESPGTTRIPTFSDELIQTVQILSDKIGVDEGDDITITTIDKFCDEKYISSIQILKTDTEGYDLEVLRGAAKMLNARKVNYVLSEATISEGDLQHTNLFALSDFLAPFGFRLYSIYDLAHVPNDGRVCYLNALFRQNA